MEEQSNYDEVNKSKYALFSREMMLTTTNSYLKESSENKNNIIIDYHNYLLQLEDKINSYNSLTVDTWHWYSWKGFFSNIQQLIGGEWDYVSNKSGGFLGYWWHWKYAIIDGKEFNYYLQIEQEKLIIKIKCYNQEEQYFIRDKFREVVFRKAEEWNINLKKYGRIGKHMGVAIFLDSYRVSNDDKLLDFSKTIDFFRLAENLLDDIEKEINKAFEEIS